MMGTVTDEELMAFADGVLDEPRFAEVAALVEADPEVAARLEALVVGGRAASAVFGGLADVPVPAALKRNVTRMVETGNVVQLKPRPRLLSYALAAGIAAVVIGPIGYLLGQAQVVRPLAAAGAPVGAMLAAEMDRLPAGQETRLGDGSIVRAIATFTDGAGQLCREFEVDGTLATVAVACRETAEWRVAIAIEAPTGTDGYAPASSMAALDAFLASIEAGEPMSPEDEQAALAQL